MNAIEVEAALNAIEVEASQITVLLGWDCMQALDAIDNASEEVLLELLDILFADPHPFKEPDEPQFGWRARMGIRRANRELWRRSR